MRKQKHSRSTELVLTMLKVQLIENYGRSRRTSMEMQTGLVESQIEFVLSCNLITKPCSQFNGLCTTVFRFLVGGSGPQAGGVWGVRITAHTQARVRGAMCGCGSIARGIASANKKTRCKKREVIFGPAGRLLYTQPASKNFGSILLACAMLQ